MPTTPIVYTPLDVSDILKIGRTKVFALLKSGELQSVLIGRSRRILPEQLDEYIEKLRREAPVPNSDEKEGKLSEATRRTLSRSKPRAGSET